MKKLFAILLAMAMLTLCACGNTASNATDGNEAVGGVTNAADNSNDAAGEIDAETEAISTEATTEPEIQESTAPSFSPDKLSAWGIVEPSFPYEFVGYSEGTNGPDLVAKFYYLASADYATAQAYVESVSNSGWGGSIPDPNEENPFGYVGDRDVYRLWIYWRDGQIDIRVRDSSAAAVFDDELSCYVFPAYGEYGTYGEYYTEWQ